MCSSDLTGGGFLRQMLPMATPEQLRAASPIFQVARGKKIPPALVLYGGQGGDVGPQAQAFAAKLVENGFKGSAVELYSKDHFSANEDIGIPGDDGTIVVTRFLQDIGVLSKKTP